MTSAAYLLFYRRRSEVPLGGPRFQEIFDCYNNQLYAADEDMADSGEGQRLGLGSSRRGSPSALTGAGLILPQGNRGLARLGDTDDDTDVGVQLSWSNQDTLQHSIEADGEDEGIGLTDYDNAGMAGMTSVIGPSSWSFKNLNSKAGSEMTGDDADIASDVAQNDDSSVDVDIFEGPSTADMDHLLAREPGAGYVEAPGQVPDSALDGDVPPPPSAEMQDYMSRIAAETWVKQQTQKVHKVPPAAALDDDDQASDKVAEIHVGDGEGDGGAGAAPPSLSLPTGAETSMGNPRA